MNEKLLAKMIRNCFFHYHHDIDSFPLSEADFQELCHKIITEKENNSETELYEIVNDIVYEYLTK